MGANGRPSTSQLHKLLLGDAGRKRRAWPWEADQSVSCGASRPTGELSEHMMGLRLVTPGYSERWVDLLTLGLEWAKARVPTPDYKISMA